MALAIWGIVDAERAEVVSGGPIPPWRLAPWHTAQFALYSCAALIVEVEDGAGEGVNDGLGISGDVGVDVGPDAGEGITIGAGITVGEIAGVGVCPLKLER